MRYKALVVALGMGTALSAATWGAHVARASDHDDGTSDLKTQNTNLTDLFVFNEKAQNPTVNSNDLIFIMNVNPRSLPRQQYYYSTDAHYEFHVTRAAADADTPTGKTDVLLSYEFGAPDANDQQAITIRAFKDGASYTASTTTDGKPIMTTPIGSAPINNQVSIGGSTLTVFSGTREDPFFFDVEQFFKVRASALAIAAGQAPPSSQVTFRNPGVDFTDNYNVLSLVTRIPRSFLRGPTQSHIFDVWETIMRKTCPDGKGAL